MVSKNILFGAVLLVGTGPLIFGMEINDDENDAISALVSIEQPFCRSINGQPQSGSKKRKSSEVDLGWAGVNVDQEQEKPLSFQDVSYFAAQRALAIERPELAIAFYTVLMNDEDVSTEFRAQVAYDLAVIYDDQPELRSLAKKCFEKSAEWGNQRARTKLHNREQLIAMLRSQAQVHLEKREFADTIAYLTQAASYGNSSSMVSLGSLYLKLKKDTDYREKSNYWYDKAKMTEDEAKKEQKAKNNPQDFESDDETAVRSEHVQVIKTMLSELYPSLELVD